MRKCVFLTGLVFAMTLHAAESPQMPQKPVRALYGFQPSLKPFEGKSPEGILEALRDLHCNALFFSGKENGALYRFLNENGIPTYHEVGLFVSKSLYQERPDLRPIRANGAEQPPRGWYCGLCPNQPELREKGLERIRALYTRPEVQGVWLDFIRYPIRWEVPDPWIDDTCFCDICLQAFDRHLPDGVKFPETVRTRTEKADFILENRLPSWIEFKCNSIAAFVADAKKIRDETKPGALLGIFTIPWMYKDYDGAIHRTVGQDFSTIGDLADVLSPMVYHGLCHREEAWPGEYSAWLHTLTQKPVWPIVQAMNEPDTLTPESFERVVRDAGERSGSGVILFTAGHIDKEKRWASVKRVFTTLSQERPGE